MVAAEQGEGGIRGRFRAQVRDEVKAVALRQLAEGGPQAVSVNAIARELGVSGPALYRYFSGRDELVAALVLDAYTDLASAASAAAVAGQHESPGPQPSAGDQVRAVAHAYRAWALAQPHRYRLLFTPPLPGLDAHTPALVEAAQASMTVLLEVLDRVRPGPPAPHPADLAGEFRRLTAGWGGTVDPGVALAAVRLWSRLHGLIGLELGGNTASMGLDAAVLLDAEVTDLLDPHDSSDSSGTSDVSDELGTAAPAGRR